MTLIHFATVFGPGVYINPEYVVAVRDAPALVHSTVVDERTSIHTTSGEYTVLGSAHDITRTLEGWVSIPIS